MIQLPSACYCSEFKVNPINWESTKASTEKDWYLYYRFYDPQFKKDSLLKKGKLVIVKGMNNYKILSERQQKTKEIIEAEYNKLKNKGYNPITGKSLETNSFEININPNTPFLIALGIAKNQFAGASSTKSDIKVMLGQLKTAATQLGYQDKPVKEISRKHLKFLIKQIDFNLGESNHRYNKIRSYLMILYNELIELEAVDANPLKDLSKKKTIKKLRELPDIQQRKSISEHLKSSNYRFWLFVNIFFHSGARLTEMVKVRKSEVDIINQTFIVTIKKGGMKEQVAKPIKDVALLYWQEVLANAQDNDFIFSKNLMPGPTPIQSYQLTKRWNRHVKKKLGIKEDLYSLKHVNLDETAEILNLEAASQMASHTSTAITLKHYTLNEKNRQNNRLKKVNNKFA